MFKHIGFASGSCILASDSNAVIATVARVLVAHVAWWTSFALVHLTICFLALRILRDFMSFSSFSAPAHATGEDEKGY